MKRMLFNATQEEELRVAMVDGQRLYDLNIELPASERKKANIYKGTITRIEPSLEAAFVNYGAERHGFLPLKEISSEYFVAENKGGGKPNIREVLKEGQDIVVQIDKEERGNKGAALTTFVSLAGRFIVLKPNKPRSGGVSRRIMGEDRDLARQSMKEVNIPEGMSVILRTAGIDRSAEELEWDMNNLLAIWEAIKLVIVRRTSPFLVYRESDSVVRALRDYLTNEIGEILVDDESAHNDAKEFIEQVMPHNLKKLKLYQDPVPLFTRYQIESQIESAFAHQVTLPSGGSMVIDHTEALVAIDINSARATKGGDIEATALQTNLEAADEVGRQLRLRDLGGLIVIDFIDMGPQKHQREVESRLRDAVRQDRARVQIGKISRFGLMEMSRQRLRPSLGESSYLTCPRCTGAGTIRSVESLALAILRIIGEEARKERTAKVIAQLPAEVATYLLNEKRDWVQTVESRHDMQVILVANPNLETPHYQIRRVRDDQTELPENVGTSYELSEPEEEQIIPQAIQNPKPVETPAIATVVSTTPAPPRKEPEKPKEPGFFAKIVNLFSSEEEEEVAAPKKKRASGRQPRKKSDGRSRGGQRGRRKSEGSKSSDSQKSASAKKSKKKRSRKAAGSDTEQKAKGDGQQKKQSKKKTQAKAGADESQGEKRSSSSRRRSRGGRRRRRGNSEAQDTAAATATTAATGNNAAPTQNDKPAADQKPAPEQRPSGNDDSPKKPRKAESKAAPEATPQQPDATAKSDIKSDDSGKPGVAAASERPKRGDAKPAAAEQKAEQTSSKAEATGKDEKPKRKPAPKPDAEPKREKAAAQASDYDDTQPELPVIRMTDDDKPKRPRRQSKPKPSAEKKDDVRIESAQLESSKSQQAAAAKSPDKRPEKPAEAQAKPPAENGSDVKKPAAPEKTEKPKGRLLPWEPQADEQSPSD